MYAYIKGTLVKRNDDDIIVENNGIGYLILCPVSISARLGAVGDEITVYLYQSVREDDISLYGLASPEEKDMFLLLITVSGIGPKVAQTICSQIEPDRLALAVMGGDVKVLTSVKGLGKKGAERIILELKDKLKGVDLSGNKDLGVSLPAADSVGYSGGTAGDAVEALIVLGYKQADAASAVSSCYEEGISVQELIRRSLKSLAR